MSVCVYVNVSAVSWEGVKFDLVGSKAEGHLITLKMEREGGKETYNLRAVLKVTKRLTFSPVSLNM